LRRFFNASLRRYACSGLSPTACTSPAPAISRATVWAPKNSASRSISTARPSGADVPKDRAIDGIDQLDFFLGKQESSKREGFPAYVADRLTAVKWRNWKMHLIKQDRMYDIPQTLALPKIVNLLTDRKEERDVAAYSTWVTEPMLTVIGDFEASLKTYPPIKLGTPDPYTPPQ
jgi:arylsulfatase